MPRVQSAVCILGRGLRLFAKPHYILPRHVCPNFIDLSSQCFLFSPAADSAYVGQCFATVHCAMIQFFGAICDPFSLVSTIY